MPEVAPRGESPMSCQSVQLRIVAVSGIVGEFQSIGKVDAHDILIDILADQEFFI